MINLENIKRIYTYIFPLLFILCGYSCGLPGISIGVVVMNIFNVLAIIQLYYNKRMNKKYIYLYIFVISIYALTILAIIMDVSHIDEYSLSIKFLKHFTWLLSISLTAFYFIDIKLVKKVIINSGLICTIYIILQNISWNLFHVFMPNLFSFGFIHPLYDAYSSLSYINYFNALGIARPASFFSEPSFYATFTILPIAYLLFDKECQLMRNRIPKLLILLLGIVISTSTTGLVCSTLLLFIYFIRYGYKNIYFIVLVFFIILCSPLLWNALNDTKEITFIINKLMSIGSSGRVTGGIDYLDNVTGLNFWIGYGAGVSIVNEYTNSIIGLFLSSGIVGIVIFFSCMITSLKINKYLFSRLLIYIYIINCFVSGMMFNVYSIYLLSIVFTYKSTNKKTAEIS